MFEVPTDHGTVGPTPSPVDRVLTFAQSHSSIIDRNGMAVALTSTVNHVFGSRVMDPVSGILLNDEVRSVGKKRLHVFMLVQMDDFSTPGIPNGFGLYPSPCKMIKWWYGPVLTDIIRQLPRAGEATAIVHGSNYC